MLVDISDVRRESKVVVPIRLILSKKQRREGREERREEKKEEKKEEMKEEKQQDRRKKGNKGKERK